MVNSTLGYDLSDKIKMITSFWDADVVTRRMFNNKQHFNKLLNNWGPMFLIKTPDKGKWLAQQREGREWFIYKEGHNMNSEYLYKIDDHQLLSYMGLGMFGVPLGTIIDNFVVEE